MEAKQIHRTFNNKFYSAIWLNKQDELTEESAAEWYYCGTIEDFKNDFVHQAINNYFPDDEIYLIITPGNSSLVSKAVIVEEIRTHINKKEIGLMNKSLTKIMHFTTYGVFKKGVILEFPKSRIRPEGIPLKVSLNANMTDNNTSKIADIIQEPFRELEDKLSNDYEGNMEFLWIDLELVESHMTERKSWSFRFQKRVDVTTSRKDHYVHNVGHYSYNAGHYSVTPDFEKLKNLPEELVCQYILKLVYDSTQILVNKSKKIEGFKAEQFRLDFLAACKELGFPIEE